MLFRPARRCRRSQPRWHPDPHGFSAAVTYASSTGGFLEISTAAWFAAGSVLTSFLSPRRAPAPAPEEKGDALPEDMSTASLIGGGLIAGESLYTLGAAIAALLALM